jgi:hypothetical protein
MPHKLSPSALALLKDCPRCFWLECNREVSRPAGVFPSLPGGMDLLLKRHFDSYRGKGVPPALAGLGVRLFAGPELKAWQNNRKGISWSDADGNVLKGAVDDIVEKGGRLIVLDFKTRGFPRKEDTAAHYQHQLDIYTFLLRKNGWKTEDYAYLLFYHPTAIGKDQRVSFHADLVKVPVSAENAEKLFRKALRLLAGKVPPAAEDCEYCRYRKGK